jgi:hypothetical protein
MKAKIQATTAILVGKSNVNGWCPVTGEPANSIYQCFPTGRLVRASSDANALEAHNNELPNNTQILSPESKVSRPEPEPAVWDNKQKIETKKVNNNTAHLVAVSCRTLPATDNYPTRIKVTLPRFQKSVTLPWNFNVSPEVSDQVAFWLQQSNLTPCAFLDLHDHCVLALEWELVPQLLELFKNKTPNRYKK